MTTKHETAARRQQPRNATRHQRYEVVLATGEYGTPTPTIRVLGERGEHPRAISAELHMLAAAAELATMKTPDTWNVELYHDHDTVGSIRLELIEGDNAEAERGMALLTRVARDAALAAAKRGR
jgi:hypothetical protein